METRTVRFGAAQRTLLIAWLTATAPLFGQPAAEPAYNPFMIEIRGVIAQAAAVPGGDAVVQLDVPDANGQMQRWTVTLGKASELRSAGITALTLAPGTGLSVEGNPSNANDHRILAQKIMFTDGTTWRRPAPAP